MTAQPTAAEDFHTSGWITGGVASGPLMRSTVLSRRLYAAAQLIPAPGGQSLFYLGLNDRGAPVRILPGGIVEFDGAHWPDTNHTIPISAGSNPAGPSER